RAAMCGRLSAMYVHCSETSSRMVPVEKLRRIGQRLTTSSLMRAKTFGSNVGAPSSCRAWMCTTEAPASYALLHSCPISSGVYGMEGHCFRLARTPVTAQVMTQRSGSRVLFIGLLLHC